MELYTLIFGHYTIYIQKAEMVPKAPKYLGRFLEDNWAKAHLIFGQLSLGQGIGPRLKSHSLTLSNEIIKGKGNLSYFYLLIC